MDLSISSDVLNSIVFQYLPVNEIIKLIKNKEIPDLPLKNWFDIYENEVLKDNYYLTSDSKSIIKYKDLTFFAQDDLTGYQRYKDIPVYIDLYPVDRYTYQRLYEENKKKRNITKTEFFAGMYTDFGVSRFTYNSEKYTSYRITLMRDSWQQKDKDLALYFNEIAEKSLPDFDESMIPEYTYDEPEIYETKLTDWFDRFDRFYFWYDNYDQTYQNVLSAKILDFVTTDGNNFHLNSYQDQKERKQVLSEGDSEFNKNSLGNFNDSTDEVYQWFRKRWNEFAAEEIILTWGNGSSLVDAFDGTSFPKNLKHLQVGMAVFDDEYEERKLEIKQQFEGKKLDFLLGLEKLTVDAVEFEPENFIRLVNDSQIKTVVLVDWHQEDVEEFKSKTAAQVIRSR